MSTVELEESSSEQTLRAFDFWDTSFFSDDGVDCKLKCNKYLKKKLKKYKKRHDEDPEVAEVSLVFNESLCFPVTDIQNNNNDVTVDDFERPQNYLMKMVGQKSTNKIKIVKDRKKNKKEENEVILNSKEQKNKTNAFQLMMDSRNKSIGSNSIGKEKDDDPFETNEIHQKKAVKVKRTMLLQKMAESKGALKNKLMEEKQDEIIKQKMDERAVRLKSLIANTKPKQKPSNPEKPKKVSKNKESNADEKKSKVKSKIIDFNIEVCPEPPIISPPRKKISKEDEEFLSKLSPSLKKQENMLCYFKKIDKAEITTEENLFECEEVQSSNIIKVKLKSKTNKKSKKSKLSLKEPIQETNIDPKDCNENNCNSANISLVPITEVESTDVSSADVRTRKRKRHINLEEKCDKVDLPKLETNEGRPRRNVKKPIKYSDKSLELSSSDDELLIFTPKKKKHIDKTPVKISKKAIDSPVANQNKLNNKVKLQKSSKPEEKAKLAPIFMPKAHIDAAALEAKQKFLQSGVPEKLKKIASQLSLERINSECFHAVVHVLQNDKAKDEATNAYDYYKLPELQEFSIESKPKLIDKFFENLISTEKSQKCIKKSTKNARDDKEILQTIKESYPEFPVYRTYRSLKNKSKGDHTDISVVEFDNSKETLDHTIEIRNEDPKNLCWVDKYKATSTKQIIGNFDSIKELRKWLVTWSESKLCNKNSQGGYNSDSSDFCHSDSDSKDTMAMTNNLLIISGPTGSGKTSCVHAVASELAIKVIEVNVGSRRTGKILLQDLQEATQSHKVNRGKSSVENSQSSQNFIDLTSNKKLNRKKVKPSLTKNNSQKSDSSSQQFSTPEEGRTGMSLILIDDADIVFEQDDGFTSGIAQLIQCSKRPVIIVTSSMTSLNVQRFLHCENIIKLRPLLPRMLGTWLDLVCLADIGVSWPGTGAEVLDYFKGDIRKAINCFNFFAHTQVQPDEGEANNENLEENYQKIMNCDENSSMSWAGGDSEEYQASATVQNNTVEPIIFPFKEQTNLLENLWSIEEQTGKSLEDIRSAVDALSLGDLLYDTSLDKTKTDFCSSPWYCSESDSVSEKESLDKVNNFRGDCREVSQYIVDTAFGSRTGSKEMGYTLYREREKSLSRHKLLTEAVVPPSVLDRRALALDYWAAFRAICRTEKVKTDTNLKRNNRFAHYLKTSKLGSKSELYDKLGDTLNLGSFDS